MPTTHVGCYRPAVLDGGSNPPISTNQCDGPPTGGPFALSRHPRENTPRSGQFLALPSSRAGMAKSRLARRGVTCRQARYPIALQVRLRRELARNMVSAFRCSLNTIDTPLGARAELGKRSESEPSSVRTCHLRPSPARPDPIALLRRSNHRRATHLVSIRYGRMARSPFAFMRGSAAIMAHDLASTPTTGLSCNSAGMPISVISGATPPPNDRSSSISMILTKLSPVPGSGT